MQIPQRNNNIQTNSRKLFLFARQGITDTNIRKTALNTDMNKPYAN